ncbi:PIN domain-like protein [Lophiostoma macrostomum CBS 122681]|uniref:PIN domain-like protein n=1 Tax=Lophiostoma macrostomum CBS 122681 TaxID=1314788 RepID=A0A6A6SVZ7_9PLEO|nr:PIN domain-like protein [Lophiostoma macrostomum CBS 122681]
MGVTGLWTVLQPCARPIKIETLNKKRLAVDASIWIYQFLKAVRDKEGNALRNSHIVGFFRRICKLLFFGIKPVFVFDGGAPALKRQTINNRKTRREGRREDAVRTAGKLLAIQMQRAAEEEEKKRKEAARHPREMPEEDIPDNLVYASEIMQTQEERLQNRKFKKKDQYHLPELGASLAEMGGQNDPRIMSLEELEEYARHFDSGEDINVYDFSKIDFDSTFFVSLPASDRYNILNAARLRSRLRMGYSKDQLDTMFPDRMAFSKFQIERVRERNELTQRLMNINGMNDDQMFGINSTNRVAGEKGREYVLVKNDGVEGGWALGVVTNKDEGKAEKPIDVDRLPRPDVENDEWEDEDEFEDVPIEGLNRLPKPRRRPDLEDREFASKDLTRRRQKLYSSRKEKPSNASANKAIYTDPNPDSLFLAEEPGDAAWENVAAGDDDALFEEVGDNEEDQQLQQAIALSLGTQNAAGEEDGGESQGSEDDAYREVFQQERVQASAPFSRGSGLAIARQANQRSSKLAKANPFAESDSGSEEDGMDLQAALAESRTSKRPAITGRQKSKSPPRLSPPRPSKSAPKSTNALGFDGPLPFEKLNLGNSLLGKKKMQKLEEANAGGFEKDLGPEKKKSAEPLPPWFEGKRDLEADLTAQRVEEKEQWEEARKEDEARFKFQEVPRLRKQDTQEVIDLEAISMQEKSKDVITVDSDAEEEDLEMKDVFIEDPTVKMGDLADKTRASPPKPLSEAQDSPPHQDLNLLPHNSSDRGSDEEPIEWSESEPELEKATRVVTERSKNITPEEEKSPSPEFEDVPIEPVRSPTKSPSPVFKDVPINNQPASRPRREPSPGILQGADDLEIPVVPYSGTADDNAPLDIPDNDSDQYSDPEDADLFASLAAEAEEHSRFAQELNDNKTAPINFDEELKQLRAQQKKDRRDADEVTQTMISECQHLLTLFGLPYITAPMEAEAQCAELVHLGLVDGIVTDDSDTFLFGGTRVYKNMFNAAKFVECYLATDLTTEFSLTREKLIAIAQLLGSDYTTGIPGIGPVTALEILSEFTDLKEFKEWWTGVQEARIPKDADKASAFRRRFRRTQTTKMFLPTNFPDPRVAEAYLDPDVDSDPQPFQWGVPDLDALRSYLSAQIGWSSSRTDEVLVPVIKDMNRREKEGTQSNITRFFDGAVGAGAFAPRVRGEQNGGGPSGKKKGKGVAGKRLGAALTRLAEREKGSGAAATEGDGEQQNGEEDGDVQEVQEVRSLAALAVSTGTGTGKKGKKRKPGKKTTSATASDDYGTGEADDDDDDLYSAPKKKAKRGRKAKSSS